MGDLIYCVLGSMRVLRGDQVVPLRAAKPRRLLATLLLHPNRFVSTDLIVDVLWEGSPPRSAVANVRTYVRAVRDALDEGDPQPIETHQSGYSVAVDVDALDATRLENLVAKATQLRNAGDEPGALRAFEEGHRLWRGRPLEDLVLSPVWDGAVSHLERLHRTATDELIALRVATGDHPGAVALVRGRLTEDPYDEDLWGQLVRGLLATGHRHEARVVYRDAVRTLTEELGVEPSEPLRAIGAQTAEPPPARLVRTPGAIQAGGPSARFVPSQLPLDIPDFYGRDNELARLRELLSGSNRARPPVAVISGAPGTGKTALAVHAGHLSKDVFTDGQIYLDMRAAGRPRDPSSTLFETLRGLGAADSAIPQEPDRRSAALRSELASRRVLVILDDVDSAGQVAPLLPGTGSSALVITSRRQLTDLTGAAAVHLDVLDTPSAAGLLRRIAGADRTGQDNAATAAIVRACGNLPLAIRIAASRLVQRPDLTPSALARRLRGERHRLDELSLGELAVRPSADLGYRSLGAPDARLYRLIGLLGRSEFPAWMFAPLANGGSVERSMDSLIEANLVRIAGMDAMGTARYRVHDLLRLHARELAGRDDPDQARDDLAIVLDGWLRRARLATDHLPYQFFGVRDFSGPGEPGPDEPPATPEEAIGWFEGEQQALVPLVRAAAGTRLHEHAWRLAVAWAPYFDLRGPFDDDWRQAHEAALDSARACGSRRGEAIILRDLGQLAIYRDDWEPARVALVRSREIFRELGDLPGIGAASAGLGTWHRERGLVEAAMPWYQEALGAFGAAGDARGEAVARTAIASIWLHRKDFAMAESWLGQAYELTEQTGDEHRRAQVLSRLAALHTLRGDLDTAVAGLRSALAIFEGLHDARCAGTTRVALGEALLRRGDLTDARRVLLHVLTASDQVGDRTVEAKAASQLGQLHQAAGRLNSAREYLTRALRAWQFIANHQRSEEIRQRLRTLASS